MGGSGSTEWDPSAFLASALGDGFVQQTTEDTSNNDVLDSREYPETQILRSLSPICEDETFLEVYDDSFGPSHIKGSYGISSSSFLTEDGWIKQPDEVALVLGDAGISNDDSVVVYGPVKLAALCYFALSYVGHENVTILDGTFENWTAAGLPVTSNLSIAEKVVYVQHANGNLIANHDALSNGTYQIIDARSFYEYGTRRIPNALHIDLEDLTDGNRFAGATKLNQSISNLEYGRPVVVYSKSIDDATIVWLALKLMGYDASIYSWNDWINSLDENKTIESRFMKLGTT